MKPFKVRVQRIQEWEISVEANQPEDAQWQAVYMISEENGSNSLDDYQVVSTTEEL